MSAEASQVQREMDRMVSGEDGQCLTFILAGEEYGVDILRVQQI
jgi:chemotaxis signal transduction protein